MNRIILSMLLLLIAVKISFSESEAMPQVNGRVYDCAANSLYILCKLDGRQIPYEKCLGYLPITKNGNNMLEFKKALIEIGYNVEAQKLCPEELRNIRVPCVVLSESPDKNGNSGSLGHFFIITPQADNKEINVYDYPSKPQAIQIEILIESLKQKGVTEIPTLLCGKEGQRLEEMLVATTFEPVRHIADNTAIYKDTIMIDNVSHRLVAEIDFGDIPEGTVFNGKFKVKNTTTNTLKLKYLKADCKCTGISCDKSVLQPGDEATILATVSLVQKYLDMVVNGYALFEHDGNEILVKLLIKGTSQPRWLCKPQRVDFGDVQPGDSTNKKLILERTQYGKTSTITKIEPDSDFILVEKTNSDEEKCVLGVRIKPNGVSGLLSGKINIYLNNEVYPATYFDIHGVVYEEFIVVPNQVLLRAGEPQEIKLSHYNNEPFEIKSFNMDSGSDKIIVKKLLANSTDSFLSLNIKDIHTQEMIKDVLHIQIKINSKIHTISVPIFGMSKT